MGVEEPPIDKAELKRRVEAHAELNKHRIKPFLKTGKRLPEVPLPENASKERERRELIEQLKEASKKIAK